MHFYSATYGSCKTRWCAPDSYRWVMQEQAHCHRTAATMKAWKRCDHAAWEQTTPVGSSGCHLLSVKSSQTHLGWMVYTGAMTSVTALRAVSLQHFIFCLLKVASAQLFFTSNNHFSFRLKGQNNDLSLCSNGRNNMRSLSKAVEKPNRNSDLWDKKFRRECLLAQLMCSCLCMRDSREEKEREEKRWQRCLQSLNVQ